MVSVGKRADPAVQPVLVRGNISLVRVEKQEDPAAQPVLFEGKQQ